MNDAIWILDDDKSIRWVLERALERENLPHRGFDRAETALEALTQERPAVVLTDIRMPGTDGLEFVRRLHERAPGTPVIVMTAYSDLDSAVSAFQAGAFEYLPKPFDVPEAVRLVRRALAAPVKAPFS